jgi:hypothetical protein
MECIIKIILNKNAGRSPHRTREFQARGNIPVRKKKSPKHVMLGSGVCLDEGFHTFV